MHKIDPRAFATAAFAIFALVLVMRSHFNTSADFWTLMVPTIIQGAAVAVFFIPLITLGLSGLAPDRVPAASGLFNFARITVGSFGTSIVTTWWDRRASLRLLALANALDGMRRAEAARLAGMERQALHGAVLRFNAEGPEGLQRHLLGFCDRVCAVDRADLACSSDQERRCGRGRDGCALTAIW